MLVCALFMFLTCDYLFLSVCPLCHHWCDLRLQIATQLFCITKLSSFHSFISFSLVIANMPELSLTFPGSCNQTKFHPLYFNGGHITSKHVNGKKKCCDQFGSLTWGQLTSDRPRQVGCPWTIFSSHRLFTEKLNQLSMIAFLCTFLLIVCRLCVCRLNRQFFW